MHEQGNSLQTKGIIQKLISYDLKDQIEISEQELHSGGAHLGEYERQYRMAKRLNRR